MEDFLVAALIKNDEIQFIHNQNDICYLIDDAKKLADCIKLVRDYGGLKEAIEKK